MFENIVHHYLDFPKPGVDFIDIMPFLQDKKVFKQLLQDLDAHIHCSTVVTVEARGFLFGAPLLVSSDKVENIVPIRKKGKLPFAEGDLISVDIVNEYTSYPVYFRLSDLAAGQPEGDTLYVTFLDDILATGGTAFNIAKELNKQTVEINGKSYKIKVKEFLFLVELPELHGGDLLKPLAPYYSVMQLAGK